jgi:hypothetical protein
VEESILTSTKQVLGIAEAYTAFDLDIMTHINSAFSNLNQLGVGPSDGFEIDDAEPTWSDFGIPQRQLTMVKTYIYHKVRLAFDPPGTLFHIEAIEKQITELEHRISWYREELVPHPVPEEV